MKYTGHFPDFSGKLPEISRKPYGNPHKKVSGEIEENISKLSMNRDKEHRKSRRTICPKKIKKNQSKQSDKGQKNTKELY